MRKYQRSFLFRLLPFMLLLITSHGFAIESGFKHLLDRRHSRRAGTPLGQSIDGDREGRLDSASSEGSGDSTPNDELQGKRKLSVARAGGRGKRVTKPSDKKKDDANPSPQFSWLPSVLFGAILLIWSTFGGGGDSSYSYYSYSSTVYETRSTDEFGQVQVERKESSNFQSNIPRLKEKSSSSTTNLLQDNQQRLLDQEDEFFNAFAQPSVRSVEEFLDSDFFE